MIRVPPVPLILGLAGLLPFLWGAMTLISAQAYALSEATFGPRFLGPYLQVNYGQIILCFMSGVLWGFAAKAEGRMAALGYALSVVPALWVLFMVGNGSAVAATNLCIGFALLLVLDWFFWRQGLAPEWWMQLRLILTAVVLACLLPVVWL